MDRRIIYAIGGAALMASAAGGIVSRHQIIERRVK